MSDKWYYRLPVKVTAVFLTAALFLGGFLLVGGAGMSILVAGAEGTTEMAQRQVATYFLGLYDWEIAVTSHNDSDFLHKCSSKK